MDNEYNNQNEQENISLQDNTTENVDNQEIDESVEEQIFGEGEEIQSEEKRKSKRSFWIWTAVLVVITLTIICLNKYVFMYTKVIGGSMENTLHSGDKLMANRCKDYGVGSIVIIKDVDGEDKLIIKRIIALEGDTVEIKNNAVYVNGEKLSEPYVKGKTEPKDWFEWTDDKAYTLKENEVFYLGDNREISADSRAHGPCKEDQIVATVTDFSLWFNDLFN